MDMDGLRKRDGETHVEVGLRYLRTLVRIVSEWVTELDRRCLRGEPLEELVVDPRLDEDPGTGATCLAVVPAITNQNPVSFIASCT